ncbi:efflux RND transporter periplasmic adaptor subunit [Pseudomonas sp.]|uniref:efflux RND transporter periplasmic adaptor subunit n=1 Tax=Pseudomonas sp. TaxID=306 RepID=UPI0027307527|nr:efflux RND transporter periplasmic adaptor subunit [Pseudomonas sp.]MDP2246030.1 efflux RND transporter periplasmic adaptor subunit [Pseudomonas sp.]
MNLRAMICLCLPASVLLAGCGEPPAPQQQAPRLVKLFTVEDPASQRLREFPARLKATNEAELSFRIGGQLKKIEVLQGQQVKLGQLIASIEDTDQRLRVRDRQASFDLANAQFQRIAKLYERQMISRSEYDQRKAALDSANAALSLARQELDYTQILAPFNGVVASTYVDNFQVVQAKQPIATLQSGDSLDVLFQLPENLLTNLHRREDRPDYHPNVTLDSLPGREFEAVYKEHSTQPDPRTLTYEVTLSMPRPQELNLLPGMSATVKVDFAQLSRTPDNRLLVPVEAVFSADAGPASAKQVWVVREQDDALHLSARAVEVGQLSRDSIEVLSGLEPGEQIVAVGGAELEEGQTVRPWVRERGL